MKHGTCGMKIEGIQKCGKTSEMKKHFLITATEYLNIGWMFVFGAKTRKKPRVLLANFQYRGSMPPFICWNPNIRDPLSTNNLLSCLSTLLLRSYMFFCVREYKLRSYIDSCNRTTRVRHINSKKMQPVSWFTKPVEQSGLMIALSQFARQNMPPSCPICRGSQTLIKKSRLSSVVLLNRQEH